MTSLLLASLLLAAGAAQALEQKPTPREERANVCTVQADDRNLRGATRSAYLRQCLKGGSTKQIAAQQEKILECTEAAEDQELAPRERRQFLARCLRG